MLPALCAMGKSTALGTARSRGSRLISRSMLTWSHVKGTNTPPLVNDCIGTAFEKSAIERSSDLMVASGYEGRTLSWTEMLHLSEEVANGLLHFGFAPGDRFGIWMPNFLEWTITQLACARIGVVLVNVNPGYRTSELTHALNLVGCKGLLVCPAYLSSNYTELLRSVCPELEHDVPGKLHCAKIPTLRSVFYVPARGGKGGGDVLKGMVNFDELASRGRGAGRVRGISEKLDPHDAINIQFTSGTTGLPKAATLSHYNIVNNGFFVGECQRLTPNDRVCIPVPLYHCFGTVLGNLAAITHMSSIIFPAPTFNAEATLKAVEDFRCTALYGVPTMFIAELALESFSKFNLSTLRTGIMAGSPCPIELMRRVTREMNLSEITIAYGMTETSPVSFQSSVHDSVELRCTTVGRIHPHVECKVVDESGETVRVNTPGELLTRGYSVMKGYWAQENATRASLASCDDGHGPFFRTGDLATIDENGYCRIVGRLKDMIIRGGENIYPREIEEFLHTHPRVKDVAVVGVPDKKYGEEICAWLITKDGGSLTKEEVAKFCDGKIAHFKVPRHVFVVESLPMTITGKIQKFVIRDESVKMIGDAAAAAAKSN